MHRRSLAWVGLVLAGACDAGRDPLQTDAASSTDHDADVADVSPDRAAAADLTAQALRAFDVTAAFKVQDFPPSHRFTVVFDGAGHFIAGARGRVTVAPAMASGDTFTARGPLTVGIEYTGAACPGSPAVTYEELTFTVAADGRLRGTARGRASFIRGDVGESIAITATLDGHTDSTPPRLEEPLAADALVDPLGGAFFPASEPLPEGTTARLEPFAGSPVALAPMFADGAPRVVRGLSRPEVALRFGMTYKLAMSQLVDMAGLRGEVRDVYQFDTEAAPPLLAEDGFERAAGPTVAGAAVVGDGALPALTGRRSAFVVALRPDAFALKQPTPRLFARLPLTPGDRFVRVQVRVASAIEGFRRFYGAIAIGAPGSPIVRLTSIEGAEPVTRVATGAINPFFLTAPTTLELAIPADAKDEIAVEIAAATSGCGLPPPPVGLLIDDLRAE